jgi:hypothetical protein
MNEKEKRCIVSVYAIFLMVFASLTGIIPADVDAGGNKTLQDTTPPEVWGRMVVYPSGLRYAKDGDLIQIRAYIADNESGIKQGYPVYDLTAWHGPASLPLFDDGQHLDGYANDSYYASEMITVNSGQRCSYEWIPIIVENNDNLRIVTSITVAVDNARPRVINVSLEYPPGQKAAKTGDYIKVTGNVTDFCKPSIDIVFDTDDSGSMADHPPYYQGNDPNNLRAHAICNFTKKFMQYPDRGTGVFFYGDSTPPYDKSPELFPRDGKVVERHLHENYQQICNDALTVQSDGGTDGWPSLELSLQELNSYGDPAKNRTIILLTDGQFNYPTGYNSSNTVIYGPDGCKQQRITIYTIGLHVNGSLYGFDEPLLKWIAKECGGEYFRAYSASALDPIYQKIGSMLKKLPVPYGVDHAWADTSSLGGKPYEELYDDGMHGDGGANDGYYSNYIQILNNQPSGEFVIPITGYDRAGNSYSNKSLKVKIDNIPPVISSVSVKYSSGGKASDGDTITIEATVSDTGQVSGVMDVYVDASAFGGGRWVKMPGSGGTNQSPPIKVYTNGRTGAFPFKVYAYDIAGNVATKDGVVEVDNQDPKVKIYSLVSKQVLSGEYLFAATAFDAVSVKMEITGPTSLSQNMEFDQKSKLWKVLVDTRKMRDGDYNVKVTAYDSHGDSSSAGPVDFRIDNTPPHLAFDPNLRSGEYLEGTQTISTWVIASDDPFTQDLLVEYTVDGTNWQNLAQNPVWDTTKLMDGTHTLTFRGRDIAGHRVSISIGVVTDNHVPKIDSIHLPESDKPIKGVVEFVVSATDALTVEEVNFTLIPPGSEQKDVKTVKLERSSDGFYHYRIDTRLLSKDGGYTYTIRAIDIAGTKGKLPYLDPNNHIASVKGEFIVDNTAPKISSILVDSPLKKYIQFTSGIDREVLEGLIYINVTVVDEPGTGAKPSEVAGVDKVYIRIDDGGWEPMETTQTPDVYQYLWRTGKSDNGPHIIEVKGVDKLGNTAFSSSDTVYIDNPDYTSGALVIAGICSFFVLLFGFFLFHWRKYKEIANTPPAGYEPPVQEQSVQYTQQISSSPERIQSQW